MAASAVGNCTQGIWSIRVRQFIAGRLLGSPSVIGARAILKFCLTYSLTCFEAL